MVIDNNFGLAPENVLQLYVIRIQINNIYNKPVFCLLQQKLKLLMKMFNVIFNECNYREFTPRLIVL